MTMGAIIFFRTKYVCVLICLFFGCSIFGQHQNGMDGKGNASPDEGQQNKISDGSGTLNQSFLITDCGLDYTSAYAEITDRSHPVGLGLPAQLTISGVPAGAVVVKALLYWDLTIDVGGTTNYTFNGTPGNATMIGHQNKSKCWYASTLYYPGYVATQLATESYRADVTSLVSGNGTYTVNLFDLPRTIDGAALVVIYKQPGLAWEGTIQINDGVHVEESTNWITSDFTGIAPPCTNTCNAKAFIIISDLSTDNAYPTHFYQLNGIASNFPDKFFQLDEFTGLALTAGQTSIPFKICTNPTYLNNVDCYAVVAKAVYYRTYSCTSCQQNFQLQMATTNESSCGACDGTISTTVAGGLAPYTYLWTPSPISGQGTPSTFNLCGGTYSVTVNDNSGCITQTASATVVGQVSFHVDSIVQNPSGCTACTGSLSASVSNATGVLTYSLLSISGGTPVVQTTGSFTNLCPGSYILNIQSAVGCQYIDTVFIPGTGGISIDSIQVSSDNGCAQHCNGGIHLYAAGATQFSINGGANFQGSGIFTGVCTGTYNIMVQDAQGCQALATVHVDSSLLNLNVNGNTTICIGASATISASVQGGLAPYTYTWNQQLGNAPLHQVAPVVTTAYTVYIKDSLGCITSTQNVLVQVEPPLSLGTIPPQVACQGDPVTMNAQAFGGNGTYSFLWINMGSGTQLGNTNPLTVTPVSSTNYAVIVQDNCGTPPDTAFVNVTINSLGSLSLIADTTKGCAPLSIAFSGNGIPAGSNISWNFGDGSSGAGLSPVNHTYTQAGCFDVSLHITTGACQASITQTNMICVYPNPVAAFSYYPLAPTTYDTQLELTNLSSGGSSYQWLLDPEIVIQQTQSTHPLVTLPGLAGFQQICLTTTSDKGCTADTCIVIEVKEDFTIYIPNTFTPNDDGLNDVFIPVISGAKQSTYALDIYDRWGQLVFNTNTMSEGWNGKYKGQLVQEDAYLWKIVLTGVNRSYSGRVSIVK